MSWKSQLRSDSLPWLLESENPGIRYLALRDLLDLSPDDKKLKATCKSAHKEGPIAVILSHMEKEDYWVKAGAGYHPTYRSTVWSIVLLAQLGASIREDKRSNPATYAGVLTPVRELFAALPESKVQGYRAGRYSFNVKGGRCEACQGDGVLRIAMHFLPYVFVQCEVCGGRRYNRETLQVTYKGASIADVLALTVDEASELLGTVPTLRQKLESLRAVGLGYLTLGQPANTLSGGEAQRLKLS